MSFQGLLCPHIQVWYLRSDVFCRKNRASFLQTRFLSFVDIPEVIYDKLKGMRYMKVEVWLWLLLVMLPYNPKVHSILKTCDGDVTEAAKLVRSGAVPLLTDAERERAKRVRSGEVHKVMELCALKNIRIITLDDEEYPARLKAIYNPPIVLFTMGSLKDVDNEVTIAVVGTRSFCRYSAEVTDKICTELAKIGTIIVSGLAVGLDGIAHRACVKAGGRTIGVLACGCLVNYPAANEQLKKDILNSGGALISELLPNSTTFSGYFHHRNRILSGLALGTLITEASLYSGCNITAEYTIEQGRDLFCIPPHDIRDPRFKGVVAYLRDGAIPVFDYIDIVNQYIYSYTHGIHYESIFAAMNYGMKIRGDEPSIRRKKAGKNSERENPEEQKPASAPVSPKTVDESVLKSLDPLAGKILCLLNEKPLTTDEIIKCCEVDHTTAISALTDLEIFGYIRKNMDGTYSPLNTVFGV